MTKVAAKIKKTALAKLWVTCVVVGALAFGAGMSAGWVRWKKPTPSNKTYRSLIIREQAQQLPPGGTIVIGDSLVERQWLAEICGPTLNAGMEAATSTDLQALVPEVVRAAKPARVVFNVGTNDVYERVPGPELQAKVEKLIAAAQGASILVVGTPITLAGSNADNFLRTAALQHGARFIPFPVDDPMETSDGLHLNRAGAAKWQVSVVAALCPMQHQLGHLAGQ